MQKVIIIAEAGVNHNGDIETAKRLIDVAADAGVDYVKFQTFKAEELALKSAKKAAYQIENTKNDDSHYEMLKKLEINDQMHLDLMAHCNERGIGFLSSAFSVRSQEYLDTLGLPIIKIPSGEITNFPYLKKISFSNKQVYLSTGMATIKEINAAMNVLCSNKLTKDKITLLHCNTEYPTPYKDVNLKAMLTLQKTFDVEVGYSDHTSGIEVPIAAVALGAKVIEKHFTLDKAMQGPDHIASLDPEELKQMVKLIRNTEWAISGNGEKIPSKSELKNIPIARKSICIVKDITTGTIITNHFLGSLRPGNGISPMEWESIIGKKVNKDLSKGHQLNWGDFEK